jgi:hypothetical protein
MKIRGSVEMLLVRDGQTEPQSGDLIKSAFIFLKSG